jgi:Tol biopolymer transport system component
VFAVNPDGSALVRLTRGRSVGGFALSPDGKSIAVYNLIRDRIAVVPAQGSGPALTLLEKVAGFIGDPYVALAWSPDGRALALASSLCYGQLGSRLYIVSADGSGLSAVPGIENAMDSAWRPR